MLQQWFYSDRYLRQQHIATLSRYNGAPTNNQMLPIINYIR